MTKAPSPQPNNGKATSKPPSNTKNGAKQQVEQQSKSSERPKTTVRNLTKSSPKQRNLPTTSQERQQPGWSLKVKATVLALAVSMLPVLTVGTATYFLGRLSIHQQISPARQAGVRGLEETELALQRQLSSLLFATGACALLSGAIAAFMANRAIRPVLNAATASTTVVNKLRREESSPRAIDGKDELAALETNIRLIAQQLPTAVANQEVETERSQVLMNISRRIQKTLSSEEILRTAVQEVRKAFKTDRVVIFRFDTNGAGTFVEESVASGLSKMLGVTTQASSFEKGYVEEYCNGRVRAIDNIYQADLGDHHIGLLERFTVKANLTAPIVKGNQLFGLLIAHQCSEPRFWQQPEIDLFAQVAAQVGFALDCASLLEQRDTKVAQAQVFIDVTRRIRESLNEEDILKTTTEEVRRAISTDRVIIYGFDANWYGTVIAESVVPGLPKALWAQINDPCFAEGYVEKYQSGRVHAINNIYEAGLTDCYLGQLEPFAVKANLVAPILKDGYLFGLLIAHECSQPRDWQQSEIDLFTQLATQVGFALDHARLLQRIDAESVQTQILAHVTRRIRESLNEEDILKTTTEEVRRAISTDRVIIYEFDANWYGTVIAESVVLGFPKALWAQINDPCFAEGYVEKYQSGRVHAINNIYEAGLTDCYLGQLEPFAVKANLVAPILKDGYLFGLLIAHECSQPRDWQQSEIDLFTQLATQVGFALDHARLLNQVEQAYKAASAGSHEQRQQKEALQRQVSELLRDSETAVRSLSTDALSQMESVTTAYNHIRAVADSAQRIVASVQQAELQIQQASQTVQVGNEAMSKTGAGIVAIQEAIVVVADKVKCLDQPAQKLPKVVDLIDNVTSQLKLYAMNVKLAAARTTDEASQEFTSIAEKFLTSLRQLDAGIAEIKPLVNKIQAETESATAAIGNGTQQAIASVQLVEETQQKLQQIAAVSTQMSLLMEEISQAVSNQTQTSTAASQAVLEVANITSHNSEQSMAVAESFTQLTAIAKDL